MKRIISIVTLALLVSAALAAQEPAPQRAPDTKLDFRSRIIQVVHRDPNTIRSAIGLLGSGVGNSAMTVNEHLKTITVRDFPENIAAIEEAIRRLDQPAASSPDVVFKISVLIGSRTPLPGASVPDELAGVVKELQSTLTYGHYGLLTAALHRTRGGGRIEASAVAEPALFGGPIAPTQPLTYSYRLHHVNVADEIVDVGNFQFSMRVPVETPDGAKHQQQVGFETPVSLRPNEKVVIGTTTMGDKALIVVVTASIDARP